MKEIPGQISLFDIADKPLKFHEAEWLRAHGFKNVYEEPLKAGIYEFTDIEHPTKTKRLEVSENGGIMLGGLDFVARWWRPIQEESAKAAAPACSHSGHTCNKKELWKVADTLDEIMCPHVCCRRCGVRLCGARCNGAEEPKKDTTDEYIQENPTCFYVTGHYLDREEGWHKMPEELPIFNSWRLIDVVLFGKKTGFVWMEHEKWEAKDWAFRSVDNRGNSETTEILAWKLSGDEPQA